MAFSMFSAQTSPIAVDFGTSSIKLLQLSGDDKPQLLAAAEIPIPESARGNTGDLFAFYEREIQKAITAGDFRGKRVVTAVPGGKTFIRHMQVVPTEGMKNEDIIKAQLQMELGCSPGSVVVRSIEVGPRQIDGRTCTEVICFAIARDTIMKYVGLLKGCKLDVVGVHTEMIAAVRAFEHVHRRREDQNLLTLYIDLGWGGTRVGITQGGDLKFARFIQFGGRHFDQLIAGTLNCDLATAKQHRLSVLGRNSAAPSRSSSARGGSAILQTALVAAAAADSSRSGRNRGAVAEERRGEGSPPELSQDITPCAIETTQGKLDLTEALETITDEIAMCLRYGRELIPNLKIDRVIFVGGESRQMWLCQHIVKQLGLSAQLGDPLARLKVPEKLDCPGVDVHSPQPGWTVPYGLCKAPTDL